MHRHTVYLSLISALLVTLPVAADDHPLPAEQRQKISGELQTVIREASRRLEQSPDEVNWYSRRGDAYFFNGEFGKAVADYEKMVELQPDLETSHWRRGIAYFYNKQYEKAARQFEIYHTFDDVDRENGIWRFLSQSKAYGLEKARAGLLKYKKDDRQPFPAVYQLFAGKLTPAEILAEIESADVDKTEREKRRFYAELYIGLNYAVEDKPEQAVRHLRESTANTWGPNAGFGPNYMWHVGRLHYELLRNAAKRDAKAER